MVAYSAADCIELAVYGRHSPKKYRAGWQSHMNLNAASVLELALTFQPC
jgi:hypothetical protein